MHISKDTIDVLRNFCEINKTLQFREGNKLVTCTPFADIVASATLAEHFPHLATINSLPRFLDVLNLFGGVAADVTFTEKAVTISDGENRGITMTYGNDTHVKTVIPITELPPLEEVYEEFTITSTDYEKMIKSMAALSIQDLFLVGDGSAIYLAGRKIDDQTSDGFTFKLVEGGKKFKVILNINDLVWMRGMDYKVLITKTKGVRIKGTDIQYHLKPRIGSKYE